MPDQGTVFLWLQRGFAAAFAVFVTIPVVATVFMAFSDDMVVRFPIKAFSTRWFGEFVTDPVWIDAAINSLVIASATAVLSTLLAAPAAYALAKSRTGLPALKLVMLAPLFVPGVVLGASVAIATGDVQIFGIAAFGSRGLVACAHTLWAMPLAVMVLEPSFRTLDDELVNAAMDLGASPAKAFVDVVAPLVSTGLCSAFLFAFVTSLNEFIMALFLTTRGTQTLPVLLWLSLRSSASPELAVASFVLAASVFLAISIGYVVYARRRSKVFAKDGVDPVAALPLREPAT